MGQIFIYGTKQKRRCLESLLKWRGWQDSNLRPPGSKPEQDYGILLLESGAC